ncbi:MAG: hypothetical protein IPN53_24755 [Comamonadaceae bacterium]|nr:hypothetical protein [Comamonadaceae bacterium]
MNFDLVIAGVGGLGGRDHCRRAGPRGARGRPVVKQSEVHGMAQRGGAVSAFMRMSDKPLASDLIGKGRASLLLSVNRWRHCITPRCSNPTAGSSVTSHRC